MPTRFLQLGVELIEATKKTQPRRRLQPDVIDRYAEALDNGDIFPPIIVFAENGSERYILADGFHRLAAHKQVKVKEIDCDLREGGLADAVTHALQANRKHGVPRSDVDLRYSIKLALDNPAYDGLSGRKIAELCGCTHKTVQRVKADMEVATGATNTPDDKAGAEENTLATQKPPDQGAVEKAELMEATGIIRAFPYSGPEAVGHMGLGKDEYDGLFYITEWMDELVAHMDLLNEQEAE